MTSPMIPPVIRDHIEQLVVTIINADLEDAVDAARQAARLLAKQGLTFRDLLVSKPADPGVDLARLFGVTMTAPALQAEIADLEQRLALAVKGRDKAKEGNKKLAQRVKARLILPPQTASRPASAPSRRRWTDAEYGQMIMFAERPERSIIPLILSLQALDPSITDDQVYGPLQRFRLNAKWWAAQPDAVRSRIVTLVTKGQPDQAILKLIKAENISPPWPAFLLKAVRKWLRDCPGLATTAA